MMGNWQNALKASVVFSDGLKIINSRGLEQFLKYCVKFLIKILWQADWLICTKELVWQN